MFLRSQDTYNNSMPYIGIVLMLVVCVIMILRSIGVHTGPGGGLRSLARILFFPALARNSSGFALILLAFFACGLWPFQIL